MTIATTTMNHTAVADRSENVSRICNQLRDLASQMAALRQQHPSNPTISSDSNVNAMDVDYEDDSAAPVPTPTPLDPELVRRVNEKAFQGMMLISTLKTMNRKIYHNERVLRNDLTDQKLSVAKVDLGSQNIKYQRKYLMNEIARCRDMETIYQDVPLVSLEEFQSTAPSKLTTIEATMMTDDQTENESAHQLMLNRLQFELEERERIDAEKKRLIGVKAQLTKANKSRTSLLNRVEGQLEVYIKHSQPLQDLFEEPVIEPNISTSTTATTAAATKTEDGAAKGVLSSSTSSTPRPDGSAISSSSLGRNESSSQPSSSDSRRRDERHYREKDDRYMDMS